MAAIDLGSNSFHVTVVDTAEAPYRIVSRSGEKVQLAAGLDEQGFLSQEAIDRGLNCLQRLVPKLKQVALKNCHVVATNTLRVAHNRMHFIRQAEAILGVPIRVLTGEEEASLIFSGVLAGRLLGNRGWGLLVSRQFLKTVQLQNQVGGVY